MSATAVIAIVFALVVVPASIHRASAAVAPVALYRVTDLGAAGGWAGFALNDTGDVVGTKANGNGFRYDISTNVLTDIGPGAAAGVTDDGEVYGPGHGTNGEGKALAVAPSGGIVAGNSPLGGVLPNGALTSLPAVWVRGEGWDSLYPYGCSFPDQVAGAALAINDHGTVVGQGITDDNGDLGDGGSGGLAFKCSPDPANPGQYRATNLAPWSGPNAGAFAVNRDGDVAGNARTPNGPIEAYLFRQGSLPEPLGTSAPGHARTDGLTSQSGAYGINDADDVVGQYGLVATNPWLQLGTANSRAFLWTKDRGIRDLTDLLGPGSSWTLTVALDINNSGQIVGQGLLNGELRGFLLTPASDVNVIADSIMVTQVVQNERNLDLLVAGKQTYAIVRVHSDTRSVSRVGAVLKGFRDGQPMGEIRPTGPAMLVRTQPNPRVIQHSFLYVLPNAWVTAGGLSLTAVVNDNFRVPETDYEDNKVSTRVTFRAGAPFKVVVVDAYYSGRPRPAPNMRAYIAARALTGQLLPTHELEARYAGRVAIRERVAQPGDSSIAKCTDVLHRLHEVRRLMLLDEKTLLYAQMPLQSGGTSPYGGEVGGCSYVPDMVATGWTGANSDFIAVHELIHAAGRWHVPFCNAVRGDNPPYPSDGGWVSGGSLHQDVFPLPGGYDYSFDGKRFRSDTRDIMTYCAGQWMSDYTYENTFSLLQEFPTRELTDTLAGVSSVEVAGSINLIDNTADVSLTAVAPVGRTPAPTPGPYHIEFYDGSTKLSDVPFTPLGLGSHDSGGQEPPHAFIDETVALPAGADRLVIFDDRSGAEISSVAISGQPPIVSESSPADGDALPASGIVTVEWASGDADGDPVTHSVLYRAAASDPWTVLGAGLTGTSFDIDAAGLAGSVNAMIRVVAYDGFNESHDDVTGLDVPDKPSVVSIDAPADGTMITAGQPLQLSGSAAPVGGEEVPDAAFRWQSDLDGVLGIGPSLAANSLSVGTHILELRVTTQSGAAATATVTVVVFDDGEAPEVLDISTDELTFGGTSTSPPAPQSFEVFDQSGGSIPWTATSDNPNVLLSVGSGTTPATVAVSIDMGGIAGGDSLSGEITLQRSDGTGDPRVIDVRAESDLTPGSVAPISIDFGRQVQGTSGSPRTVTFTNNGGERITLGAAELAGAAPSEFSLPTDQCAGVPLSTGQSCAVGVTFGPSRAGRREAYLVLPDSDTDSAWYVSLTGLAHRQVAQPDGKLLGWGKNHAGQVGVVNTTPPCSAGIRCVPLLRDIGIADAIAATSNFFASAAITSDGTPLVWGTNCLGVFANGVYGNCATNVTTPQQPQYGRFSVEGLLTGVTDIAAGADHFVALRDDGSVVAWGSNSHAQVLGCGGGSSGAWISRAIPVRTTPCDTNLLVGVVAVAAGYQPDSFTSGSSYALKTDGTVVQWGATHGGSNSFGTLEPVQILGPGGAPLSGIVEIAAQMALHQNGTVWTWGEGLEGQLGNGQLSDPSGIPGDITAVQVLKPDGSGPLTEVKAIASFDRERYALTNDGRVLAWGSGAGDMDAGIALGIGGIRPAVTPLPTPVLAPGGAAPLTGVVDIAAGLARRPDGSVVAWGDARYGVLGDGTYFFNPWGNTVAIPPNPDAGPRWSVPVRGEGGNGFLTGTARLVGGLTRFALTGAPGGGGGGPTTLTAGSPVAVAATAGTAFVQVIATFGDSLPTEAFAFSVNVDWGDDSEDSSAVVTGPDGGPYQIHGAHTYESAGDYELTIDVASRSGDSITLTGTANVDEVTLGALPARESPFVAGTTASHPLAGFTTPNRASDEASFHAMVDWGDGAPPEAALVLGPPGGPFDVVAEHAYRRADTDPYPLVLHVTDEDGAEITLPGTAIVTPASLVADATFGTDVLAGRSFSGSIARFRDGNPLSRATDYSALIRWGDEIETVGVLTGPDGGPYTVAGSHEYLGDGPFGVDVILNGPGTSASASTTLLQRQHRLRLTGSATPTGGAVPLDVTFTYVAHNDGANALWLVDVFGTSCGSAIRSGGDPNGNGVLDPGEAWAFTCERTFGQTGDVSDFAAATAYGLNDALGVRSNEVSTPISVGSGWPFSGFFQPVDNPPGVNVVKAGSTVPVKFGLGADRGLDIFASGFPASARTACDSGSLQDDLKQIAPPGAAALTYDATASRYHFNWKTVRSWAGTCRKLTLRFRLGGEQTALFRFK